MEMAAEESMDGARQGGHRRDEREFRPPTLPDYYLTCLICGATEDEVMAYYPGWSVLVAMQQHVMETHGVTQEELRAATREGSAAWRYSLPDGRPWLMAWAGEGSPTGVKEMQRRVPENDTEYLGLPEHLRDGFRDYIEGHDAMGHFGMACLRNDLTEACSRADGISGQVLIDIMKWLYNEAPSDCWGSPETVREWLAQGEQGLPSGFLGRSSDIDPDDLGDADNEERG